MVTVVYSGGGERERERERAGNRMERLGALYMKIENAGDCQSRTRKIAWKTCHSHVSSGFFLQVLPFITPNLI